MRSLRYARAVDAAEAVRLLADTPDAAYLGGGTNLVDLMKLGVLQPGLLVDVRRLTSGRIEPRADGGLTIGAAVLNSDLAAEPLIRRRYPVVSQALLAGASGQLRNAATTAGNLLQRTRCGYFQDVATACNKREPGSGCSAIGGQQRDMAILGASQHCVATHPSDLAVALATLDAKVHTHGPSGHRTIPLTELHRLPGHEPWHETVLEHGELITSVELPPLPFATTSRYRKVRDRASYAFALVSAAGALDVAGGVVRDVRLALGGVAHRPWRAYKLEAALRGAPATAESFAGAADAELAGALPLPGNAFKVPLARNVVVRLLLDLAGDRTDGGDHA